MTSPTPAPTVADPTTGLAWPEASDGDHDRFAHYCKKEDIVRSAVTGESIVALCGKRWVPTRDPDRFPVCPTCVELLASGRSSIPEA